VPKDPWVTRASKSLRDTPKRFALAALVLAVLGGALVLRFTRHRHGFSFSATSDDETEEDAPIVEWCAEGLEAIPGGGCYASPANAEPHAQLPLLIYLHGLIDKGPLETEERDRQRRVALRATEKGFAVLALRGAQGACTTDPERASLICWPSNERTADKGPAFVESWQPSMRVAAQRHPFKEKVVLGFSNGGFFAGLVAERALYDANAFVIANAGPVEPVKASGSKPPLLLMSADEDPSQEGMVRLDDELTREDWPHAHHVRDGGHALPDSDIDVALTFFERIRTEPLPFHPPLSTRVPRARTAHRDVDAEGLPATTAAEGTPAPAASVPASEIERARPAATQSADSAPASE
jgi:dienelactone hydrolase